MVLCSSTRLFSLACKPGICWSPRFTSHAFLIPDSDLFKFEAGTVLAFWLRKDKVFRNDSITNLNSDRLVCRCSPGGRFGWRITGLKFWRPPGPLARRGRPAATVPAVEPNTNQSTVMICHCCYSPRLTNRLECGSQCKAPAANK